MSSLHCVFVIVFCFPHQKIHFINPSIYLYIKSNKECRIIIIEIHKFWDKIFMYSQSRRTRNDRWSIYLVKLHTWKNYFFSSFQHNCLIWISEARIMRGSKEHFFSERFKDSMISLLLQRKYIFSIRSVQ